jgi:SAM-dependent methyltransferase
MTYSLNANNIFMPDVPVVHRDDEYDSGGFEVLREMQSRHFWYLGRHRFLLQALKDHLKHLPRRDDNLKAIDLGGGCGGWLVYLRDRMPGVFGQLALSDSSLQALELAGPIVGENVARYQTDLLRLGWEDQWDSAFLLDVLEHIPNDKEVLLQIARALKPGGLLFITTPALQWFWSYNDDVAHHLRRYAKRDFARLAMSTGLQLRQARYFMFFLSPLLWLSRRRGPRLAEMSKAEMFEMAKQAHRVPAAPVNGLLQFIFGLETPLGLRLPFPWGTSILGVFQKPS